MLPKANPGLISGMKGENAGAPLLVAKEGNFSSDLITSII